MIYDKKKIFQLVKQDLKNSFPNDFFFLPKIDFLIL